MNDTAPTKSSDRRGHRKVRTGIVMSDKMEKTAVVRIELLKMNPMFKKYVRQWKNVKAHDESNDCRQGDRVQIVESRPMSKEKHWRVMKVLERAK